MSVHRLGRQVRDGDSFIGVVAVNVSRMVIKRGRLIRSLLVNLLSSNRVLLRNIPKLTGALTVGALTSLVSTGCDHVRFAPSLLPTSIVNAVVCDRGDRRFRIGRNPIFTGFMLTSRVGHTPTGIRDTLLRTVRRHRIAVDRGACELPSPFLMVTARGPVRRRKACPLPRTRMSHFVLGIVVGCPGGRRRGLVVHRGVSKIGPSVGPVLAGRRVLRTHGIIHRICLSRGVRHCVMSVIFTAHFPRRRNLTGLTGVVSFKTSPHTSVDLTLTTHTCTFVGHEKCIVPRSVHTMYRSIVHRHVNLDCRTRTGGLASRRIVDRVLGGIRIPWVIRD